MPLRPNDINYFNRGQRENPRYWSCFGGKPDFRNAVVVDLGCGHGSLCIDIALSGARRVIGLDLNPRLIDLANENLRLNFPQLAGIVEFRLQDLSDLPEGDIDYFVSKDTFEHVIELESVLAEIKKRLKVDGWLYSGFGPLWRSPFGDHGRTHLWLPWGHLMFTERFLVNWRNRRTSRNPHKAPVTSIHDLGLNALSLATYRRLFQASGMAIVAWRVNADHRPLSRLFGLICQISFLEEYFSLTLHGVLQNQRTR